MRTSVLSGVLMVLICGGARNAGAQVGSAAQTSAQTSTQTAAQADLAARRKALNDLLAERWEYTLRSSPLFASFLGDKRRNDQWDEFSQKFIDDDLAQTKKDLVRFEAIDTTGFPEQEALNKPLMVRDLQMTVEGARFKPWEMPVSQNNGPHIDLPQLVTILSFTTVKDYDDYISRLKQMPRYFDENVIQMRKGMADGLMPPRILLDQVVTQANRIGTQAPENTPFAQPFTKFPDAIPAAEQKRLRDQGIAAIRDGVLPTYVKFTAFVRDEYAPKGLTELGMWALPDGGARYRFAIRQLTTTDLTPEQIHELGLKQIDEIEKQMLEIAHQQGFKDLATFNEHIKNDRKFYATSGQQVLDLYAGYVRNMEPELPKLFGRLPKARLEAIPMEASRAKNSVPADYSTGTPDGSRPGHINVNEYDPEHRLML